MKSYRVTLREQKNKSGRTSLYLDIYPPIYDEKKKKETRRKFLDLYLFEKPNNKIEREHNKFTLVKAKKIESEWQMDLLGRTLDMPFISSKDLDFLAYFKSIVKKRYTSKGNYDNWLSTYNYLEDYTKGQCLMSEVDEAFCQGFKDYLDSCYTKKSSAYKLSVNSKYSYFNKFRAAIKQAMEDKHLHHNPILRIKAFPQGESFREFLTLDEVKKLKAVRCDNPVLERAAFWSIRTGMRWGDCLKLRWIDLQYSEDQGYFIRFNQNKTKSYETLPITEEAVKELGNPAGDLQEYVFKGLTYSSHNNFWNNLINEQKLQVLEQVENPIGLPAFVMGKDWWEPSEVRSCLRCLPLRRLPHKRSGSSKCPSISASRAASKNFFNKGAKAPSLP